MSILGDDDTDGWKGGKIKLVATDVEYAGDLVRGIRVRRIAKASTTAKPLSTKPAASIAPDEDEIGF